MSDLIDKLVEGAGQVISEVDKRGQFQTALSGIRHRMAEADRKRKIKYAKDQLQDLRAQEAQAINALSAQVLALHEAGTLTQPELVSLCKGVDEIRVRIKESESELEQLQPPPPEAPPPAQPQQPKPHETQLCPSCHAPVVTGATFCQSCGTRLEEEPPSAHFCIHCGAQLREGAKFCPICGQSLPQG